ncbi:hypothetical protein CPAR01_03903 [Colletotrichum paranaense]|uniref:Uncharacterized protein n=4 Tax=Colletotrichum acutatum species complex TaxID=2707335 RepID=A0AAI9Z1H6_9PEZI|nr:hypothetical protein CSPX01_06927 [Colletotrichum filicis]KAK1452483.1 hypothetical protein CCUS01_10960 [Colletotrichum cuscutae]KAK1511715.1 hypothetical protein CTAM01_00645 [Colletotrichum tamarilloi]KAK1530881.1 hypothetical protein CCOS01_05984 [Colletotrichum costaricense]KAK1543270.1 hypothetical protein CPAR01_03903 [Colletotrichum paranaense]
MAHVSDLSEPLLNAPTARTCHMRATGV